METFNEEYRRRTKQLALSIIRLYPKLEVREEFRVIGKQLLRSGTSVSANFRASCVARSKAEHISKLSIVIEECDETVMWLDLLEELESKERNIIQFCKNEAFSILQVMSKARKNCRRKSHIS